jgi:hypothetical protein
MAKILIPLAATIVLAALFYLGVLCGKPLGAAQQRNKQKLVDPALHDELGDFVLDLITSLGDIEEVTILPAARQAEASRLAARVRAARRLAR